MIGDTTYFKSRNDSKKNDHVYQFSNNEWTALPPLLESNSPLKKITIVSVDGFLTTVGGRSDSHANKEEAFEHYSNELYSYIDNRWVQRVQCFPSMPTPRADTAVVYTNNTLVVAGGDNGKALTTVEILDTVKGKWSSVKSLPVPMPSPSATICGEDLYIHPRTNGDKKNSVYKCKLEELIRSQEDGEDIWDISTPLPVSSSSLFTVNNQLFAVGGEKDDVKTNNIYQYINPTWPEIGHMSSPRLAPLTAVCGNKLMVVGGHGHGVTESCELFTIT